MTKSADLLQILNPDVGVILSSGHEIEEIKKRDDFETKVFLLHKLYTIIDLADTLSKPLNPQVMENKEKKLEN